MSTKFYQLNFPGFGLPAEELVMPRLVSAKTMKAKAIKQKCWECSMASGRKSGECLTVGCPLWPVRPGRPRRKRMKCKWDYNQRRTDDC